jgi:pantoate--beta-alanine ligase
MILFKKANDLYNHLGKEKSAGRKLGFVPTMGALHLGHMALVEAAQEQGDLVICSIFVNPTQFNDPEDFQKYPLSIEKDIYQLERKRTDILFLPGLGEIYPDGTARLEQYDLGYLDSVLEGRFRPRHFQGVCQVMKRLLSIVEADHLFMGQKDYQQGMVIKTLLELMGSETELRLCPTVREPDGLAMSSRNARLNPAERKKSSALFQALGYLKKNLQPGNLSALIDQASDFLAKNDFRIDYVEIADLQSLELVRQWNGQQKLVALIAAFQDEIRLIDNLLLNDEPN